MKFVVDTMVLFHKYLFHLSRHRNVRLKKSFLFLFINLSIKIVHTLPRQNNQTTIPNNNASVSTQDMLHVNGPSSMSTTAALINAFIDSDDEPLYDKVASDEDYTHLPNNEQQAKRNRIHKKSKKVKFLIRMKMKSMNFFF